jgi:hypothetical protein
VNKGESTPLFEPDGSNSKILQRNEGRDIHITARRIEY